MRTVRMADLREMAPEKREAKLGEIADATRHAPNGEIAEIDERIRAYEAEHGMTSEDALAKLEAGLLRETFEIAQWLSFVKLRHRLAERSARSS